MKTITADSAEVLSRAADQIEAYIVAHQRATIALGANDDCLRLYRELAARCKSGQLDLSGVRFFTVTEFEGLLEGDKNSCRRRLQEALLSQADPTGERSFFLNGENAAEYDAMIEKADGLDLVILGIGPRARIGFNEPATPFDAQTHRQKLTKATRRELSPLFGGEEKVPDFGYTMGIHTLLGAKDILVLALGEDKADPVFRMLYARTDSFVPAAFLQLSLQVTVYADDAAAAKL